MPLQTNELMSYHLSSKTRPKAAGSAHKRPLVEQRSNSLQAGNGRFGLIEEGTNPLRKAPEHMPATGPAIGQSPQAGSLRPMAMHNIASRAYMHMARPGHGPVNTTPLDTCPYCGMPLHPKDHGLPPMPLP